MRRTPEETSRSTILGSASLETAMVQSGQRNTYDPWLLVAHTRTVTWRDVSSTSPQVGQLALIVATGISLRSLACSIGPLPLLVEIVEINGSEDLRRSLRKRA